MKKDQLKKTSYHKVQTTITEYRLIRLALMIRFISIIIGLFTLTLPCGAEEIRPDGPPFKPAPCGCAFDYYALLAAADSSQPQGPPEDRVSPDLSDRVRKAGELLNQGEIIAARDIIRAAARECESGEGPVKECAQWSAALKGMEALLDKAPKREMFTNVLGMKLVKIPSGEYMMGSPKREMDWLRLTFKKVWREGHKQWFQDEMPLHPVRITRSFFIGATVVTVGQFRQFIQDTGYKTDAEKGDGGMIYSKKEERWVPRKEMKWDSVPWQLADNQPVVFVSWNDADAFCKWLSRKEKRTYRLPTEAEWEMACRGGHSWARFPWGDRLPGDRDSNFGDGNPKLPESLTTVSDGYQYVSPVTAFPANAFGIHDMAGNVMQWVQDRYERNYYENSPVEDPTGPPAGQSRVNKGGNWYASPADARCAFRGFSGPTMNFWNMGFRIVMEDDTDKGERKSTTEAKSGALPPSEEDGVRLFREAMFAAQQQQWDEAVKDLEDALKIYEKRDDFKWIGRVKATLAGIYAERNRQYKAKELYTQALADFRKIGDATSARVVLARLQDLETSPGVKVTQVRKGGIADRAGVVVGDVIVEYGGETGFRVSGFKKLVEDYLNARQVTLSVMNTNNEISAVQVPGGTLGVAVEDIKKPPRPRRPPEEDRNRDRRRARPQNRR